MALPSMKYYFVRNPDYLKPIEHVEASLLGAWETRTRELINQSELILKTVRVNGNDDEILNEIEQTEDFVLWWKR